MLAEMRREFSKETRRLAAERAKSRCELCGGLLQSGLYFYDHVIPDAMLGEPTLQNCQVICKTCHNNKTHDDRKTIAKSNHVRERHYNLKKRGKFRGWRRFNGDAVWND